jgi:hypothetical protein
LGLFIFNSISPIHALDWLVLSCAGPCASKHSAHHHCESGELTQCAKGNIYGAMMKQWEMDPDEVFEELRERKEERRLAKEG